MRDAGTGSIREYQTRQGTRYRVSLPRSLTGGKQKYRSFSTREEAEKILSHALTAAHRGEAGPAGDLTLREFGARWLDRCEHKTVADDRSRWQRFIAPRPIAEMPIEEVQPVHIKRLVEGVARTRKLKPTAGKRFARAVSTEMVSAQTVRHVYGLLRRCFAEARVEGHVESNPCDGYRLPDAEHARRREAREFLTLEEIEQVLGCEAIELKYRLIYEVAIFTGLRQGELWGLRWEDIRGLDGDRPACACRRSYDGKTKNRRVREFALLPRAAAALRRWRDIAKHKRPTDLIFPGGRGKMHADGYDAEWAGPGKNREKAGLREELVFHSFRHTFASHLIMGSWGPAWRIEEVKEYIGHSSISVTQQYAHLSKSHLADLASRTRG